MKKMTWRHLIISSISHYSNENIKVIIIVILMTTVHCFITFLKLFGIGEVALNKNTLKILGTLEITEWHLDDWLNTIINGDLTTWTSVFILDTVIIQMLGTQGWTRQSLCPHILVVAQKEAWFGCCCRHVRKLRDSSKVIPQFAEFKQQQEKLHQEKGWPAYLLIPSGSIFWASSLLQATILI